MIKRLGGFLFSLAIIACGAQANAQSKASRQDNERWQQAIEYYMEVDMDVKTIGYKVFKKLNTPIILRKTSIKFSTTFISMLSNREA